MGIPQILQQLGRNQANPMLSMVKQAKTMLNAMGDPQGTLNRLVQQNPQVQQIIQQYGSVDGAVTALCQQKGIDPQEFINALK